MALTVVVGLPAVGILLIAALLIIPAATARFWTERFSLLLGLAALIGAGSGIGGTLLSDQLEKMPAGPSIVLTGTAFFLVSLFFAPRRGLVASWLSRRILRDRLARHRLLCTFFDLSGCKFPQRPALPFGVLARQRTWSPRRLARLLRAAQKDHVVDLLGDGYTLTDVGLCEAAQAARRQRLWEALLHDYPDQALHYADLDPASLEENVPVETKEEVIGRLKAEGRWSEYFG
jgi:manganese/zinc/iron transport system permease protein